MPYVLIVEDDEVTRTGTVLTRERLLGSITHRSWDRSDRTVDVLIRRLRRKIEGDSKTPEIIITAQRAKVTCLPRRFWSVESYAARRVVASKRAKLKRVFRTKL